MIEMRIEGDLSTQAILEKFHLEPGGLAQRTLTRSVIDNMVPYWAYRTGRLANSAYDASNYETGEIVYPVDYAHKMYYGVDANGYAVHYNTAINPLAGPYPFERMKADRLADIVEEVRRVVADKQY